MAEDLGKRLVAEIEEVGLDEVCSTCSEEGRAITEYIAIDLLYAPTTQRKVESALQATAA